MEVEQTLQDRLERLEAGEALENVLRGLVEEERELLLFAAQILAVPKPRRDAAIVRSQYQQVVDAARQNRAPTPRPLSWLQSYKWLIPVGAFLILCAAVTGVYVGMNWFAAPDKVVSVGNPTLPASETTGPGAETPLPGTPSAPVTQPHTALLFSVHGIVQVQSESGTWLTVQNAEVQAGQTIRTWSLSSAELIFFDGSLVTLGQNTLVTLETLQFQPTGERQIRFLQTTGETYHTVVPASAPSTYQVQTPYARGEALGTSFQVSISEQRDSRFAVDAGEVTVTGQETTVNVAPGQVTIVKAGTDPSLPVAWISGEGEVNKTGSLWIIDGMKFQMHEGTTLFGNPNVGDLVAVEGRLLADGTRLADRIEKQAFMFSHQFRLLGLVETSGVSHWQVAGQEIQVNEETQIDSGIATGSRVLARGYLQVGGEFLTTAIQLLDEVTHFEFSGIVEQAEGETWTVSGIPLAVGAETVQSGAPTVGDVVHVAGQRLSNGPWQAETLEKISIPSRFEFIGTVKSTAPWIVEGVSLSVRAQTQISPEITVGTQVHVAGRTLENGTWQASEIQSLESLASSLILVGTVESVAPWIINGSSVNVTEETVVIGNILPSSLARVYVRTLEDGTWQALQLELIDRGPTNGCLEFADVVISFDGTNIGLQGGIVIPREVAEVSEELREGDEVWVHICYNPEDIITFASLTTSASPEATTQPEAGPLDPTAEPSEEKVTICHVPSGNSNNAQTILVPASAVDTHLSHGDYLGPCQSNGEEDDTKDDKDDKKDDKDDKKDDKDDKKDDKEK